MPARGSNRAASRLLEAQAQQPQIATQQPQASRSNTNNSRGTPAQQRPRASTLTMTDWTLPCPYCANPCPSHLPCCGAWSNHSDYVQLWRALAGIRDEYPRGTERRTAIDMWMEVDEYEPTGSEQATEDERIRAVEAWRTLEEIREEFPEDHPVSKAMDSWLDPSEIVEDGA